MKTYTIIAGVNGAGKSSLTGVLRQEMNDLGVIVDVDKLAAANNGNNILAGRLAIQRIRSCLKKRRVLHAGNHAFRFSHRPYRTAGA